jgi:hypothetical protein
VEELHSEMITCSQLTECTLADGSNVDKKKKTIDNVSDEAESQR